MSINIKRILEVWFVFFMLTALSACGKEVKTDITETVDGTVPYNKEISEENTEPVFEETTEEKVVYNEFHDFYKVDCAVLCGILENQEGIVDGAVVLDSNEDGNGELFVSKLIVDTSGDVEGRTYYAFGDIGHPVCKIYTEMSEAQSNFMGLYDGDKIFFKTDFAAIKNGETSYCKWDNGWICEANQKYYYDEEYNCILSYTSGENEITADEYNSIVEKYNNCTEIPDNTNDIKKVLVENADYDTVIADYENHLKQSGQNYILKEGDIDCDGINEVCFFVCDYAAPWRSNLWSYAELDKECFVNEGEKFITLVYIDKDGKNISFEVNYIREMSSLSDVVIGDRIAVYDSYNYIHEYEIAPGSNIWNLNKVYYNGSLEEALYSQTFYSPHIQSPSWTVYRFEKNGKCISFSRSLDLPECYGEMYYDYTFDASTNTLTICEDGFVNEYTYNEDLGIFATEFKEGYDPDGTLYYMRFIMVALPGIPMNEEYSYYNQFYFH